MLLNESIAEFITEQRCRGHSRHTIDYYTRILREFEGFASKLGVGDVAQISLGVCKQFYLSLSEREISSISIQSYIRGFRAYVEWLYSSGSIEEDICKRFKLPKAKRKVIDVLTDEELRRIFRCFDLSTFLGVRDHCICMLMADSGLRLHEVVSLRSRCVHLEERYLIVSGKGNSERIVPFGDLTARALGAYIEEAKRSWSLPSVSFFVTLDGCPICDSTLKDMFRRLKYRADIPRLHPHLLRHTFATNYLANGGDIYTLQRILGHSSLDMVKRYLHLSTQLLVNVYVSPMDSLGNKKSSR